MSFRTINFDTELKKLTKGEKTSVPPAEIASFFRRRLGYDSPVISLNDKPVQVPTTLPINSTKFLSSCGIKW